MAPRSAAPRRALPSGPSAAIKLMQRVQLRDAGAHEAGLRPRSSERLGQLELLIGDLEKEAEQLARQDATLARCPSQSG
jgi:hypothetical protein